ncbi:uncharacterized mitochondrial protein AtMg00810-like [Aristolochia californica]|uniref:uncharacterized mitochondrial protein AtMg00810-like n=1 Tax=Aristolochia californica TaxID=171875 RepID=UPI0035D9CB22
MPNGSIECLKARLVTKGYTQIPGLDYTDTFSPLVKATTVRVVLSLVVTNLMSRMHSSTKISLKMFTWNIILGTFTLVIRITRADTSLFVFHQYSDTIYMLLYVHNIIITHNNSTLITRFTHELHSEFATKYLGSLSYFLGLEASPTTDGLFIGQLKYARDILTHAHLLDSKLVPTHMVISQHLSADGSLFSDPTLYRFLFGVFQYLTITRPDITHAINSVSQYLHAPTDDHFLVVKCILRYVKGIIHFGLIFRPSATFVALVAYFDADWVGCSDTRLSTSGYTIYLGNNLISWSAKKQPTVSRSSCESEYRALAHTTADTIWLTHLLTDLHIPLPQPPLLLCDNKSAIFFSSNTTNFTHSMCHLTYKLRIFSPKVFHTFSLIFFQSKLHVCSNPNGSLQTRLPSVGTDGSQIRHR